MIVPPSVSLCHGRRGLQVELPADGLLRPRARRRKQVRRVQHNAVRCSCALSVTFLHNLSLSVLLCCCGVLSASAFPACRSSAAAHPCCLCACCPANTAHLCLRTRSATTCTSGSRTPNTERDSTSTSLSRSVLCFLLGCPASWLVVLTVIFVAICLIADYACAVPRRHARQTRHVPAARTQELHGKNQEIHFLCFCLTALHD